MKKVAAFFKGIGKELKETGLTFKEGDWKTKVSFLIMGFGSLMRRYYLRGIAFLAIEVLYIWYMVAFGAGYLAKFSTLGTVETHMDPATFLTVYGDNSFLILLWGLLTIILTFFFVLIWFMNVRENRNEEQCLKEGKKVPSVKEDLYQLLDAKFHVTLRFLLLEFLYL